MKNVIWLVLGMVLVAGPVSAEHIYESYDAPSSSGSSDTSTVDLSDVDTSQPVNSPSFQNTTPAGQAPGGPIE